MQGFLPIIRNKTAFANQKTGSIQWKAGCITIKYNFKSVELPLSGPIP